MDFGKVEYIIFESNGSGGKRLRLTLVGQGDEHALKEGGLSGLRKRRIVRLTQEAYKQGGLLSYKDLAGLLLTSLATLKRDVRDLKTKGEFVPIKGRKANGNSGIG